MPRSLLLNFWHYKKNNDFLLPSASKRQEDNIHSFSPGVNLLQG